MESSIAVFLMRQIACEQLPTPENLGFDCVDYGLPPCEMVCPHACPLPCVSEFRIADLRDSRKQDWG